MFVVTCLLQCIEIRSLLQDDVDRLEQYNFRCLRKMLGWTRMNLKSYEDVWSATGTISIATQIGKLRIQRAAKYSRQPTFRITKILMMEPKLVGTKPAEHKKFKSWKDNLRLDLLNFGMTLWDLELSEADLDSKLTAGVETFVSNHMAKKLRERETRDALHPNRKEELRTLLRQKALEKAAEKAAEKERRQQQKESRRRSRTSTASISRTAEENEIVPQAVTTRYGRVSIPRITITSRSQS